MYQHLDETVPGLASVTLKRISLERRRANFPEVERLYTHYVTHSGTSETKTFYVIKYARYLAKVIKNKEKAVQLLDEHFQAEKSNSKLLLQLLDLEFQGEASETRMLELFNQGVDNEEMSLSDRTLFSQRKLDYLEDFGASVQRLQECYDAHQKLIGDDPSRKRKATETGGGDEAQEKKSKTDSNGSSGYGDYYNYYQQGYGNYDYSGYYNQYHNYYGTQATS